MNIKLVLFFLVILFGALFSFSNDTSRSNQKWYVIIMTTVLVLESCLRSVNVGPDTMSYYYGFQSIRDMSWGDILDSFSASYQRGEGKDPGFAVFVKIIQIISIDFNFFLFIAALLFFIPLGIILYNNTSHILQLVFAFSLYVALFHIVALSGIRQQMATGLTFFAFLLLEKRRLLPSLLVILLASLIHVSAAIFFLVPILLSISPRFIKTLHLSLFATIPLVVLYSGTIMTYLASFLANDYYGTYGQDESAGGAMMYIVLMELLSLLCYFTISKKRLMESNNVRLLYVMLPLLTLTVPLTSLNGAMIRVGQYFTLYMMVLAPLSIDAMTRKENRRLLYYGMIAALIALSLRSGRFTYYFFWQDLPIY